MTHKRFALRAHASRAGRTSPSEVRAGDDPARLPSYLDGRVGGPGWNRTSNPQLRRLMLYPIELRTHRQHERIAIATFAMATLLVSMEEVVGPAGIEPATLSLEG